MISEDLAHSSACSMEHDQQQDLLAESMPSNQRDPILAVSHIIPRELNCTHS